MANKFLLVPEGIYRGLTSSDTGELNLDFMRKELDKVRRKPAHPTTKNVKMGQALRRYLNLRNERENRPVRVQMVATPKATIFKPKPGASASFMGGPPPDDDYNGDEPYYWSEDMDYSNFVDPIQQQRWQRVRRHNPIVRQQGHSPPPAEPRRATKRNIQETQDPKRTRLRTDWDPPGSYYTMGRLNTRRKKASALDENLPEGVRRRQWEQKEPGEEDIFTEEGMNASLPATDDDDEFLSQDDEELLTEDDDPDAPTTSQQQQNRILGDDELEGLKRLPKKSQPQKADSQAPRRSTRQSRKTRRYTPGAKEQQPKKKSGPLTVTGKKIVWAERSALEKAIARQETADAADAARAAARAAAQQQQPIQRAKSSSSLAARPRAGPMQRRSSVSDVSLAHESDANLPRMRREDVDDRILPPYKKFKKNLWKP